MTDTLTLPPKKIFPDTFSDALVYHQGSQVEWKKPCTAYRKKEGTLVDDLERELERDRRFLESISQTLLGDLDRERSFQESISQIKTYRHLALNWDTYGGLPASEQAMRFSTRLLEELQIRAEISPPYVCPISTGVYIEWRSNDTNLYFEVDEDSVLFAAKKGERDLECGEDVLFDVNRAVELVERFHQNAI